MKSIILAGGKGERLRPYTNDCPKSMVLVNDKPLVEYQIEWMKKHGVKEITFACGHLHEVIKEYFGDGSKFGMKISYSVENEPLGRGGAIKKAWMTLDSNDPIVVTNGDIYTEINLANLMDVHRIKGVKATICLFPFTSPYGIVNFSGDSIVTSFEEKPVLPYWINGGVYIFDPTVREMLPNKGDHETTIFPKLAKEKEMYGYKSSEYWVGVDTTKDLSLFRDYTLANCS